MPPAVASRVAPCAALLLAILALIPGTAAAHEGHLHADMQVAEQAAFIEQLEAAPASIAGSCFATAEFDGIGQGCRTADGMLRVELPGGGTTTTHGPDFAESPADADPDNMPPRMVAAIRSASADDVACTPTGQRRFQLVYAIPNDAADRFVAQAQPFRQSFYEMSAVVDNESRSLSPTASRKLRVACDAGTPSVLRYRLPTRTANASFSTVRADLAALTGEVARQGATHYLVFYDAPLGSFAGIADIIPDATPGPENDNNTGGLVALLDTQNGSGPEWETLLHEAAHTMGAVSNTAPDTSGAGHCIDGDDVMCYNDGGPSGASYNATTCSLKQFDCDHDSYFHPDPTSGYLTTNWNLGGPSNAYIARATVTADTTAPTQPGSLTATGLGGVTRLTWSASTDAGSGMHAYRIYKDVAGVWTPVGDAQSDADLDFDAVTTSNTTNSFRVTAYDDRGNESTPASVTIASGASTGTVAQVEGSPPPQPLELTVASRSTDSLTFRWRVGVGGGVAKMKLCRIVSGNPSSCFTFFGYDQFPYNGLTAGTSYTFGIASIDHDGRASAYTTTTATTSGGADVTPPAAPTGLAVTATEGIAPRLAWNAVGDAASYAVYREASAGVWSTTDVEHTSLTEAVRTGLNYSTTPQNVAVAARDATGNESAKTTVTVTTNAAPDTTAPSTAPLTSYVPTVSTLQLSWTAATDNVGIAGYRVLVSPSSVEDYTVGATTTSLSATLTGLLPETQYHVKILPYDAVGRTPNPGYYQLTTSADTTAPTTPTGLVDTGVTNSSIALSWNASTDDVGVTGYRIYQTAPTNAGLIMTVTGTTATITGLQTATPYTFNVRAIDAADHESASASITRVTTATPDVTAPSQPAALTVGTRTGTSIALLWDASSDDVGVTGYRVYRDGALLTTVSGASSYDATGLTPSTSYLFEVAAIDGAGNASTPASVTGATLDTVAPTQPPSLSVGTRTETSVALSWGASTDNEAVSAYRITRSGVGGGIVHTTAAATTSYTVTGLSPWTSYTFEVWALDAAGNASTAASADTTTLDTTAPSQPGALAVSGRTGTSIALTWSASTDNSGVTGYRVYRNGTLVTTTTATSYTQTGLASHSTHTFEVEATDGAANTSPAAGVTATTLDVTAPSQPASLTVGARTGTSIALSWAASTDNSGVAPDYRIYRDGTLVTTTASTSYVVGSLAQYTTYDLEVLAVDAAGNASTRAAVSGTTLDTAAPSQPTGFAAGTRTGTTISLTWTASTDNAGVTGYRLYRDGVLVTTTTSISYTVGSLTTHTTYDFEVEALDAAGNVSATAAVSATTLDTTAPSTPGSLASGARTGTSIAVTWTGSTDNVAVTGYRIYRSGAGGGLVHTAGAASTAYTVTGLTPFTSYTIEVEAIDAAGNASSRASVVAATLDTVAPTQPGGWIAGARTETTIALSWTASTDNDSVSGYRIYRANISTPLLTPAAGASTATISGLAPGTAYTFEISAVDGSGNESARASLVTSTTDATAPTAPGAITVGTRTGTSIALSWAPATDNVGVAGYRVYRDGTLVTVPTVASPAYTATGLEPWRHYAFEVRALDAAGNESSGVTASATTLDTVAPAAPASLDVSDLTGSSLNLAWPAASDNDAVASYELTQTAPSSALIATYGPGTLAHALTGLAAGTSYAFEVVAVDPSGNRSARTTATAITTDAIAPTAPSSLTLSVADNGDVQLAWAAATDAAGVVGYRVSVDGGLPSTTTTRSKVVTGLTRGAQHSFSVTALDAAGNESPAASSTILVPAAPAPPPPPPPTIAPPATVSPPPPAPIVRELGAPSAPQALTVTVTATTARAAWSAPAAGSAPVASYRVTTQVVLGTPQVRTTTEPFVVLGPFRPRTSLRISVTALNASGESAAASTTVTTLADTVKPTAPSRVKAVAGASGVLKLTWAPSRDNVKVVRYELRLTTAGRPAKIVKVAAPKRAIAVTKLKSKAPYKVLMRALDARGNASKWVVVSARTR